MKPPTIAEIREFAKAHGLHGAVLVFHDGERSGYVSWGVTKRECSWMRRYADTALGVLHDMWFKER